MLIGGAVDKCHNQVLRLSEAGGFRMARHVNTWFGMFGGWSPKPTQLWGTPSWLPKLHRVLDRSIDFGNTETYHTEKDSNGRTVSFSGGKRLKETQAYPAGYGRATAKLMKKAVDVIDIDDMWVEPDICNDDEFAK